MDRSPLPSPTNRQAKSTPDSERDRQASIRYAWPLTSCSVPTQRMLKRPEATVVRGFEEPSLDPRVDDDDLLEPLRAALTEDQIPVVRRDGHDEGRFGDLLTEHVPVDVEIGSLRREAVGMPVSRWMTKPAASRMVREVAMDVLDALRLHGAGGVSDFRKDPDASDEEVQAAERALDQSSQGTQVGARPTPEEVELAEKDRPGQEREEMGAVDDCVGFRVNDGCSLPHEGIERDFGAGPLEPEYLEEDERLGQLWEPRRHVADLQCRSAPVPLPRSAPTFHGPTGASDLAAPQRGMAPPTHSSEQL